MKKETFDSLPYIARKELVDLRDYMNSSFNINTSFIFEDHVDSVLYQYRDYTTQFAYNIDFLQFDPQKNGNIYKVYFSPRSLSRIEGSSSHLTFEEIKPTFIKWIENVVKMHEITQEYYDPVKTFYDKEFAEYFSNDEPDSATNPFEVEKQEIIYYFLKYAEETIIKSKDLTEETKDELVQEITELQEDLPKLTKKRFVSALSKFAQKIKKSSNKVFHEVFDVLKKEVIKQVLYKGVGELPSMVHRLQEWIDLFK